MMKNRRTNRIDMTHKFIFMGLGCAALFWIFESIIHAIVLGEGNLIDQIFFPDPHEIWMRLLVVCMIIVFTAYARIAISRYKQMQEVQHKLEREKSLILSSVSEAVTFQDTELKIKWANRAASECTGESTKELVGCYCYEVWRHRSKPCRDCPVLRALETGEAASGEKTTLDGRVWLIRAYPVRTENGDITGAVEVILNITERKRMEQEIEENAMILALDLSEQFEVLQRMNKGDFSQPASVDSKNELVARLGGLINQILHRFQESNRKLDQSNQELQDFVYVASHDLRAPLRKISSFGRLLQNSLEGKLDNDQKENLEFMIDGANRLHQMVDALLVYSRVTTKTKPAEPVDLNEVMENLKKVELATQLEETRGSIVISSPLPVIQADPSQVHELLQNLIGNGLKYHRQGTTPKIEVRASKENGTVRVEVEDNGIGVDEHHHRDIFTMFKRLHSEKNYEGTGVGLAICKKIVERHGGNIGIKSTSGGGSTFWFTFPTGDVSHRIGTG